MIGQALGLSLLAAGLATLAVTVVGINRVPPASGSLRGFGARIEKTDRLFPRSSSQNPREKTPLETSPRAPKRRAPCAVCATT